MRILTVHSAANRLSSSKNLLDAAGKLLGHGAGSHDAGGLNDVIHGDVTIVLDVLHLLPVPGRFLESLDDESSGRGHHGTGGLSVLNLQLYGHLQTLPVTGSLGNVISNLLGRQTQRTNLQK